MNKPSGRANTMRAVTAAIGVNESLLHCTANGVLAQIIITTAYAAGTDMMLSYLYAAP
jgi:hypothetical protein